MRKITFLALLVTLLALPLLAGAQTLRIHYHRFDDNYSGWGIHLWNAVEWADGGIYYIGGTEYSWDSPFLPTGTDDYGVYWDIPIAYPDQELGFIIHLGSEKDPGPDQFWDDYTNNPEIWILSGFTQIFTSQPDPDIRLMSAASDGRQAITLTLGQDADQLDAFHVYKDEVEQTVSGRTATTPRSVLLTLPDAIDITAPYTVSDEVGGNTVPVLHDFDEEDYIYEGDDLGVTLGLAYTTFKLWSPVATQAFVRVYDHPWGSDESYDSFELTRPDESGVMAVTVPQNLHGFWYLYEMTVYGETWLTPDLYSTAMSSNSRRSAIVDLDITDPEGWEEDQYPDFPTMNTIIWEAHIRDITTSEFWNGTPEGKHKFAGVVESGTSYAGQPTGLDHILDLGVNTVQILPMYDFSSVDELNPNSRNWGYDPYIYNTPEGSYSTDPDDPTARIREMKEMIQGFHDRGIKVVMDVVYNHTHNVGPQGSTYDAMVPKYYYRLTDDGSYANGSGVGNEVASEKAMARRFIEQSCRYWVEEYHIDGFRFDLMGLIDTETMTRITSQVKEINPHAIIYGEPWGGYGGQILTGKGDQRGLGFGVFNDNIRNAIRGSTDGTDGGFAMGDGNDKAAVIRGIEGSINDFTDHASETLNYISAHDNYTWWDKIDYRWNPNETPPPHYPEADLRQMSKLGLSIVMTSQGIPFLHAGSEFLRTKRTGDPGQDEESIRNSYASNDEVNKLDWERRADNAEMVDYVKGLIDLRQARYEFRLGAADSIAAALVFVAGLPNTAIAYTIADVTPDDDWGDLLVVHNAGSGALELDLPGGHWAQVVDGDQAGTEVLATMVSSTIAPATISIPKRTTAVLYQQAQPQVQLNLFQNAALDAYLQLAVNAPGGATTVTVTINGSQVPLTSQAVGTWTGSYEMTTSGGLEISLTTGDVLLTRRLTVANLATDSILTTADGVATLLLPASKARGWVVAADREGHPELGADRWLFGAPGTILAGARLQIQTDRPDVVIERRDQGTWTVLPTTRSEGLVTADTDRLGVFRLAQGQALPRVTRLLGNMPNPFNPSTAIRFEVAPADASRPIRLGVYDLRGRLIRTLHDGPIAAGLHARTWDGRDRQGSQVASGVYFYKLSTAERALTGRMLLIK